MIQLSWCVHGIRPLLDSQQHIPNQKGPGFITFGRHPYPEQPIFISFI